MKERLSRLMAEYGPIALAVYLSTSVLTFAGAAIAISRGVEVSGVAEGAGVAAASWVVLKISQPVRLLITFALTPIVGRYVRRTPAAPPGDEPNAGSTAPTDDAKE